MSDIQQPEILEVSAPSFGHRKISAALGTFAAGSVVGVDLMIWIWDMIAGLVAGSDILLPFMPATVAQNIVTLISFLVLYRTREDVT